MIDGQLVVDATVHGFNFGKKNMRYPWLDQVLGMLHTFAFDILAPHDDPRYRLSPEEFQNLFQLYPDLMEQVLFAESQTDIAVYHGVPMYGLFEDGSSPVSVARPIKSRMPHRMFIYGDLSPTHPEPLRHIDWLVDEVGVIGVKFYPVDMVEGRPRPVLLDADDTMPLIARARDRGLKVVAVHKAVPLGPIPRDLYRQGDLAPAIAAFPDITFEIVHGGFAFAEETAALMEKYPNVVVNLETNPCFALNQPEKFADILAPLLATGRHDSIYYATGACGMHPQPFLEAFWRFEMPKGYPRLTEDMKAGMLGANFARLHGWDVEALKSACRTDAHGLETKTLREPWRLVKELRRDAA
jgi:uncharacterized protein